MEEQIPSFVWRFNLLHGDLKIEAPQSAQECIVFFNKVLKRTIQLANDLMNVCECRETYTAWNLFVDEECKKPDSPFQKWLNE